MCLKKQTVKLLVRLLVALVCAVVIWQISPYISWSGHAAPFIGSQQKLMVILFSPVTVIGLTFIMLGCLMSFISYFYKKTKKTSLKA